MADVPELIETEELAPQIKSTSVVETSSVTVPTIIKTEELKPVMERTEEAG